MKRLPLLLIGLIPAFAAEPTVVVQPSWISQNQQSQFDEQGRFQRSSGNLSIHLKLIPPPTINPLASKGVRVTAAKSNTGEDLIPHGNDPIGVETYQEEERKNRDFGFEIALRNPKQALQEIATLTGVITLEIAKGQAKQAQIGPLKDWFGKPMLFESVNESLVVNRKDTDHPGITLNGSSRLFEQFLSVSFLDAAGNECSKEEREQDEDNGERTNRFQVTVPDDGAIRIIMRGETATLDVPFALEHLTLRPVPTPPQQMLKIKLEDVPQPAALPPVKVVNPENEPAKF